MAPLRWLLKKIRLVKNIYILVKLQMEFWMQEATEALTEGLKFLKLKNILTR